MSRSEVSRTNETSRHFDSRHFFMNIQEAKSVSGRSVSERSVYPLLPQRHFCPRHFSNTKILLATQKSTLQDKCTQRGEKCLAIKCLQPTKLKDPSLRDTSFQTPRKQQEYCKEYMIVFTFKTRCFKLHYLLFFCSPLEA